MARRLVRERLKVAEVVDVLQLPEQQDYVVKMDDGDDIDIYWLSEIDNAPIISQEINVFLRGQSKKRTVANVLLQYLKYVSSVQGYVGVMSAKDYRGILSNSSTQGANTKAQKFSVVTRFIKQLMDCCIIPYDDIPANLSYEPREPKSNFIDVCRYEITEILESWDIDISEVRVKYSLDTLEAEALIFSEECMSKIQEFAVVEVQQIIADWKYFDGVISSLDKCSVTKYENIGRFSDLGDERSIGNALKVLYVKYGRILPASSEWPIGLSDYCKYRGWKVSRINGVFFPVIRTLESFLVIALASRDLMPNVDSVAFYSFIDCCKPSHDKGMIDIHFGKMRGKSISKTLKISAPVIIAFKCLSERVKKILVEMPGGIELLQDEFVPIMLKCKPNKDKVHMLKTVDRSSTSDMVRRFIKRAAREHPELQLLDGKITGENFRPTHSYIRRLTGESCSKIKTALGHKDISTTESYVSGVETKSILNRKYLGFQRYLLDESNKNSLEKTGSGYHCSKESGAVNNGGCIDFHQCFMCEAKRIVFDDVEIVANWLAWESLILKNKSRLQVNNPERWSKYWELKLVEYQSLIILSKKRTLIKAKILSLNIVLPPLD